MVASDEHAALKIHELHHDEAGKLPFIQEIITKSSKFEIKQE